VKLVNLLNSVGSHFQFAVVLYCSQAMRGHGSRKAGLQAESERRALVKT